MITNNAKKICDAVLNDWRPEYDFLPDHFRLPLTKSEFYSTSFNILNNRTISDYIKEKNQGSKYYYATFRRRAEILISNGLVQHLEFNIDSLTLDNALSRINVNISLNIKNFEDDKGNFNFESWFEYLLNNNRIEVTEDFDDISFFLMLTNLNNIIQFYGVLPYLIKFSDDRLYFYCINFANKESTFFVSVTNPLASHFLE
ncbi:hypothetical protein DP112_00650 [Streptococcus suis]|uniref:hypothetical protein n=1 Tax=Streptococcus suis TaxID=1307 RepID=UPI000E0BCF80|nr:hypothetical protein [Streptococcus suis]AXI66662.1 hypothetical protein DP112_00650 [Streptococcus suis]